MKGFLCFIVMTGLVISVTACGSSQSSEEGSQQLTEKTEQTTPENKQNLRENKEQATPENQQQEPSTYLNNPHYIDEGQYQGDELEIVQALNRMMRSTLSGDAESYRSVLTKKNDQQVNTEEYLKLFKITYLSDPSFYNGPSEYHSDMEVGVDEEIYHPETNLHYFGRVIYLMFKEEGEWKIGERKG
ncbi:hypothetical protein [Paenibacillus lautus]|uniref:hypothetical protein n=1 Tax=Paenibacillus lautus TaxID=1401 RepID=UPI003D2AF702